jgi:hypothetical protein
MSYFQKKKGFEVILLNLFLSRQFCFNYFANANAVTLNTLLLKVVYLGSL